MAGAFSAPEITLGSFTHTNRGGFDGFVAKMKPDGVVEWARRLGGSSEDFINGLAADTQGNVIVSAVLQSTNVMFGGISFTTTSNSMTVVLKLNGITGATIWSRKFEGRMSDGWTTPVGVDRDGNAYISAAFANHAFFLSKLDPNGNTVWEVQHGRCSSLWGPHLYSTKDGEVLIAGSFTNAGASFGHITLTNTGPSTAFAAKYSSSGNVLWAIPLSSGNHREITDMVSDKLGNAYVLFRTSLKQITSNGQIGWEVEIPEGAIPHSLSPSESGGILLLGDVREQAVGLIAKFSASGEELWCKSPKSPETENSEPDTYLPPSSSRFFGRAATDPYGRIYFTGTMGPLYSESPTLDFDGITFYPVPNALILVTIGKNPALSRFMGNNSLTLSWPTNEPGFSLESTPHLGNGSNWTAVTNSVTNWNSNNAVTVPISSGNSFFRLRKATQ